MRTNLIISENTVQEIQKYAAGRDLKFYEACNRLLKLGIGFSDLFGETIHKHVWIGKIDDEGRRYHECSCGATLA